MTKNIYKLLTLTILVVSIESSFCQAANKVVVVPLGSSGTLAGKICPSGEFVYGFDASGNILCSPLEFKVFITSAAYDGNLGGVVGANNKCQEAANVAGLNGTYKAWISDSTSSPSTTFTRSSFPYVTTAGDEIALNWDDLTDGNLKDNINADEYGNIMGVNAWTNTDTDGTNSVNGHHCNQWTSNASDLKGLVGVSGYVDRGWTSEGSFGCQVDFNHLYCFQQ